MDKRVNPLLKEIIGAAIRVHKALGPGLLESAYRECLAFELMDEGFHVQQEVPMPIVYCDMQLNHGYRLDILVENLIVVELKTVEAFTDVHFAQLLTYVNLGKYPLGLLLNFRTTVLKDGIKRIINSNLL